LNAKNDLRFKTLLVLAGTCFVLTTITSVGPAEAGPKDGVEIEYEGQLLDERQRPVAGVFPLEFAMFKGKKDKRPAWRETHWVSVVDGKYAVRLGATRPIRDSIAKPGDRVYLSVQWDKSELTREAFEIPSEPASPLADSAPTADPTPEVVPAAPVPAEGKAVTPPAKAVYKSEAGFADVADYANRAGVAENADKLGGKSLTDVQKSIKDVERRLDNHRADADLHGGGDGAELGSETTVMPRAGGGGGRAYVRECPPGHVVTGIRGGAGALIDSIQLVCSPLGK
jgi:hypothetical protein